MLIVDLVRKCRGKAALIAILFSKADDDLMIRKSLKILGLTLIMAYSFLGTESLLYLVTQEQRSALSMLCSIYACYSCTDRRIE